MNRYRYQRIVGASEFQSGGKVDHLLDIPQAGTEMFGPKTASP
jgi:hypothetical protein